MIVFEVCMQGRCCFFQAEDGIRYRNVTGVQTCALPISGIRAWPPGIGSRPTSSGFRWSPFPAIGRASCRERVEISVVAVSLKKKNNILINTEFRKLEIWVINKWPFEKIANT